MSDQEWDRICNRASITHTLALIALVMGPYAVWALAPEFVAQFEAVLSSTPYGEGIEAALFCAWLVCLIGTFFPPRRIFGRGVWVVLTVGLFGLALWAAATDVINDVGEIPSLGATGSTVASVVWVLLMCLCIAGVIFDGPKSWERRYQKGDGEVERKV